MKVDFMIIGAQKCGTTSLAAQLAAHPEICFSKKKEPGYFNASTNWRDTIDQYHRLFEPTDGQLCGEASTMYTFLPEYIGTARRLHEYNPDLKLIYIMRNPVDRIVSHFTHNLARGQVVNDPLRAVKDDPTYMTRSHYAAQIAPYLELFGQSNVLLIIFEEYVQDQLATLERIAQFLEIDSGGFQRVDTAPKHKSVGEYRLKSQLVEQVVSAEAFQVVRTLVPDGIRRPIRHRFFSNKVDERPQFSRELLETLWCFFEADVAQLERLLGREIHAWKQ